MLISFFIIGSVMAASFLAMAVLIFSENRRSSAANLPFQSQSAGNIVEPLVSSTAYGLIDLTRQIIKHLSIHFLVALHSLATFARHILTRIEKRFALLIDAVRGHSHTPTDRRGSVSFFLEQIKDYKDEMTRRANIR